MVTNVTGSCRPPGASVGAERLADPRRDAGDDRLELVLADDEGRRDLEGDAPERTAVLFYGATLLVIAVVITVMTIYTARRPEVLKEGVTTEELRRLNHRTRPAPAFYGAILILALLAPRAAVWMFLVVAITSVVIPDRSRAEHGGQT